MTVTIDPTLCPYIISLLPYISSHHTTIYAYYILPSPRLDPAFLHIISFKNCIRICFEQYWFSTNVYICSRLVNWLSKIYMNLFCCSLPRTFTLLNLLPIVSAVSIYLPNNASILYHIFVYLHIHHIKHIKRLYILYIHPLSWPRRSCNIQIKRDCLESGLDLMASGGVNPVINL